jgi:hypothetical protein
MAAIFDCLFGVCGHILHGVINDKFVLFYHVSNLSRHPTKSLMLIATI